MKKFKIVRCTLNIVICVVVILVNIHFTGTKAWCNYVYLESYADSVYTGIQNSAAMTANNLLYLSHYFEGCIKWISFIVSAFFSMLMLKNIDMLFCELDVVRDKRESAPR